MAEDQFPKVGVEFVAENYDELIDAIKNVGKDIDSLGEQMTDMAPAAAAMTGGMAGVGAVLGGLVVRAGDAVLDKFAQLRQEMIAVASTSMDIAGEVQMLGVALQTVARNAGIGQEELRGTIRDIEALGITSRSTYQSLTNLITSELDITDATELFRAAQDVATTSMRNSSQTAETLVYAITRLDTQMLRSANIIVDDLGSAYAEYGKTIDKIASQLTVGERQQALYNQVIIEAAKFSGAYEASMKTVAKQLGTQERHVETLYQTMGNYLIPSQYEFVVAQNHVLQSLTQSISAGGRFEETFTAMGAISGWASQQITRAATNIVDAILGTAGDVDTAVSGTEDRVAAIMETLPMKALFWGTDLMVQYSLGIMQGVSTVLVGAMRAINGLLKSWLMPHSPPKVAPRIGIWGGQTMTEYLKGFTKADYSVLKGIQSPLKSALDLMVSAGQLGQTGAANIFTDISEAIARDMLELGALSTTTFDAIAQSTGAHGIQIAKLAALYSAYTLSINEAADASNRLTNAQQDVADAQKNISRIIAEYNELRRAGAPEDVLRAKRDELDMAKSGLLESKKELGLAEDGTELAGEKADFLKEQVDLQSELVKQLQTIAQMQLQAAKAAIEAPELGGAGVLDGLGGPGFDPADWEIDESLGGILDDVIDEIRRKMETAFAPVTEAWGTLKEDLAAEATEMKDNITTWLSEMGIEIGEEDWEAVFAGIKLAFEGLALSAGILSGALLSVMILLSPLVAFATVAAALMSPLTIVFFGVAAGIVQFAIGLKRFTDGWEDAKIAIGEMEIWEQIKDFFDRDFPNTVRAATFTVKRTIRTFFEVTLPTIIDTFITWGSEKIDSFKTIGGGWIDGLRQGLEDKIGPLLTWLQGKVDSILALFDLVADSHSPSRRTAEAGRNWMRGLVVGLEDASALVDRTVAKVTNNAMRTMQTATALPSGGSTINNEYNFSVDANYANQQSPAAISDDLAAMIAVSRMS